MHYCSSGKASRKTDAHEAVNAHAVKRQHATSNSEWILPAAMSGKRNETRIADCSEDRRHIHADSVRGSTSAPRRRVEEPERHLQDEPERPARAAADEEEHDHQPSAPRRRVEESLSSFGPLKNAMAPTAPPTSAEYLGQAPRPPDDVHLSFSIQSQTTVPHGNFTNLRHAIY
jgi:hypothetical protein